MKTLAAICAALLGLAVLSGCAAPPPPAEPAVVSSVETARNITVTVGADRYLIYNTALGIDTHEPGSCEADYETAVARGILVGRTVTDFDRHDQWTDTDGRVLPGYTPAKLRFATLEQPDGDDLSQAVAIAYGRGYAEACPAEVYTGPLSEKTYSDTDTLVYVDGDDGESRFCARRWWC